MRFIGLIKAGFAFTNNTVIVFASFSYDVFTLCWVGGQKIFLLSHLPNALQRLQKGNLLIVMWHVTLQIDVFFAFLLLCMSLNLDLTSSTSSEKKRGGAIMLLLKKPTMPLDKIGKCCYIGWTWNKPEAHTASVMWWFGAISTKCSCSLVYIFPKL